MPVDEAADDVAEPVERMGVVVHQEIDGRIGEQLPLEIDDREHHRVGPYLHADEITRIGIQAVDVGSPASGRALLAEIVDEALLDQLADEFRHGRHAQIDGPAQIRNARIAAENVLPDNLLFENRVFVAFRSLLQKRTGHISVLFNLRFPW